MPKTEPQKTNSTIFFCRRDMIILAVLFAAAVLLFFAVQFLPKGATAHISITGSAGDISKTVDLSRDALLTVTEGAFPVYLEVKDGAIRFVQSTCPDHDCEGFGWLRREGEWALCAPAGVSVRIVEG